MPSIIIYAGNDLQTLGELRTAVAIAERAVDDASASAAAAAPRRAGDPAESEKVREAWEAVEAAKKAYDAFIDEAAGRADEWIIEPIGHEAWRDLLKAHPPRQVPKKDAEGETVDHEDDAPWGVNTETFPKALLTFADPDDDEHRTVVKAGDASLSELAKRLRRLPHGQFETLWIAAYQLNVGGISDPKLSRFSTTQASSAT